MHTCMCALCVSRFASSRPSAIVLLLYLRDFILESCGAVRIRITPCPFFSLLANRTFLNTQISLHVVLRVALSALQFITPAADVLKGSQLPYQEFSPYYLAPI